MYNLKALDPRTKIVMLACISTGAMAVRNIWFLAGLLIFTVLLLALGRVEFGRQLRQARAALGMVVFLFLLQVIFLRNSDPLVVIKGFTLATMDGVMQGGLLSIRLLIIIMSALIVLTGETRDYLLGLTQWKVPYEIAFMVMVGLHFFPILKEEAMDVYYSIQLRGTELKKTSLRKKLKIYKRISMPILAGAIDRARSMSIAMEARCFRYYTFRTYMRRLKFSAVDIAVMIIFLMAVTAFIIIGRGGLVL